MTKVKKSNSSYPNYTIELYDKEWDYFQIEQKPEYCLNEEYVHAGQALFSFLLDIHQKGFYEYIKGNTFLAFWNKEIIISKDFDVFMCLMNKLDEAFEFYDYKKYDEHFNECIVYFCKSYSEAFQLAKEYLSEFNPDIFD